MERFGRYVLLERIAHGGMAEVFRAANVGTEGFAKLLAVKRILPHLASDKAFVTMLVDEARISATLNHPNVLQVLDLGRVGNVYFIAMEFVAGQALNHVVAAALRQQYRLPPGFAFHVISQALRGLAYAHDKTDALGKPMGIIHRDVSPQNIMVAYDGAVRLADFGIAKAAERSTQTLTGSLKGKPAYMSPEQVQGAAIDGRVDLYAMGVVLHELVAMRRMRRAQTDVQLLLDVAKGEFPTFESVGVNVPAAAAEVVYRALSADPAQRWQTAREFADACDDVMRAQGWHFGQAQVAQVMARLFSAELEKERAAQGRFQALVTDLSHAQSTGEVNQLLRDVSGDADPFRPDASVEPTPGNHDAATMVTPPPAEVAALRSRSGLSQGTRPTLVANPLEPSASANQAPPARAMNPGLMVALGALPVLLLGAGGLWWMSSHGGGGTAAVGTARAQLVISTTPAGARVVLGGKALEGVTPLVAADIPEGPVEVELMMPGMMPLKDVVQVKGGTAQNLSFTLQPRVAQVRIITEPEGAQVFLGTRAVCTSPCSVEVKGPGNARVRAELSGYQGVSKEVAADSVPDRIEWLLQKKEVRADPAPQPRDRRPRTREDKGTRTDADEGGDGALTIQSRPWARLWVDGRDTGRFTPVAELTLAAGKHNVKLVNDEENLSAQFTITIKAGETLNITRELH